LLTGVCLTLLGRAKVHWSEWRSQNNRRHYRAEEIYIDEQVYVFGSRESSLVYSVSAHRIKCTFFPEYQLQVRCKSETLFRAAEVNGITQLTPLNKS